MSVKYDPRERVRGLPCKKFEPHQSLAEKRNTAFALREWFGEHAEKNNEYMRIILGDQAKSATTVDE